MYFKPSPSLLAAVLCLAACSAQAADTCEELKSRIEANIAGKGVLDFSVTVVDEAATVTGQVVGHCGNGTQKIVYSRGARAGASSAGSAASPGIAAKPAAAPVVPKPGKNQGILTECKDGTVSVGGTCKR